MLAKGEMFGGLAGLCLIALRYNVLQPPQQSEADSGHQNNGDPIGNGPCKNVGVFNRHGVTLQNANRVAQVYAESCLKINIFYA